MNRVPSILRWLTAAVAGVALLTGLFVLKGQGQREAFPPEVTASANPSRTSNQPLQLLVVVVDEKGATTGAAILSQTHDSKNLRIYNLDPQVVIDLGVQGMRPLSATGQDTFIDSIQNGIEAATGIPIDAALRLQRLTLAGLIDSVGGISLDSAKGFLVSGTDANPVYVPEGMTHVSGAQAAYYATFSELGAPESERIARLNQVLSATFQALPLDAKRLNETIESLGAMAGTNVPTAQVVSMIIDLNKAQAWQVAVARTLPTVPSDLEESVTSTWLRVERSQTAPIGDAMEKSGAEQKIAPATVLISGGLAADRLRLRNALFEKGFQFIDGGNPGLENQTQFTASKELAATKALEVLAALGMDPLWQSRFMQTDKPTADVVVTLGSDFIITK